MAYRGVISSNWDKLTHLGLLPSGSPRSNLPACGEEGRSRRPESVGSVIGEGGG
jgi:hypothetical protein